MILDGNNPSAIATAARALRSGALLGLPTETVYGLAADASSDAAVAQIFATKGRPSDHPLIVHVADAAGISHFASDVPAFAQKLVDAFWPGPLTLILPRLSGVATAATGGQDSVGLRCPAHPVAHALLVACAAPADAAVPGDAPVWGVAAPSANRFGRVSPTTAQHVQDELGEALLVLDGGPCQVGIESTIVDCTRGVPVLLRPGAITREQIQQACGVALAASRRGGESLAIARSHLQCPVVDRAVVDGVARALLAHIAHAIAESNHALRRDGRFGGAGTASREQRCRRTGGDHQAAAHPICCHVFLQKSGG